MEIYSKYLDFNEFKIIFNDQYLNEYDNSFKRVQTYDLLKLKSSIEITLSDMSHEEELAEDTEEATRPNLDIFHNSDDSCLDKDYTPEASESSTDEEISRTRLLMKPRKMKRAGRHKLDLPAKAIIEKENRQHMESTHTENKSKKVQNLDLQDKTEKDRGRIQHLNLPVRSEKNESGYQDSDRLALSEIEPIGGGLENETDSIPMEMENTTQIIKETYSEVTKASVSDTGAGYNKFRNPKRRKKFVEPLKERQAQKKKNREEKCLIKNPCDVTCRKKCTTKITYEQRKEIHDMYVALNYEAQGIFIKSSVEDTLVKRRMAISNKNRKYTYVYYFNINNLEKIEVCKKYFLTTLGYKANNDTKIRRVIKKAVDSQKSQRGKYKRINKIDKNKIITHITAYNPRVSHYRRAKAPNRFYLPSDLSISLMYKHFCEEKPDIQVSLEYFRLVFKDYMNISFVHLGNEECEYCAVFVRHNLTHKDNPDTSCEICNDYLTHKKKNAESHVLYQNDLKYAVESESGIYYSVDLQKVVMLPRINRKKERTTLIKRILVDQLKAKILGARILAFNESFVPLSETTPDAFAVLWDETIAGRTLEDIISTFREFLLHNRDAENITLWLDNNAEQNKNWYLLSFLVAVVNSNFISAKTITLQYFEPCNNSMSVQSFHHEVERSIKIMEEVYDFSDFVECVRKTNSGKNYIKVMTYSDFFDYKDFTAQHKLKIEPQVFLRDVMSIRVERGLFKLMYKTSHNDKEYAVLDFLKEELIMEGRFPSPRAKTEPKGIDEARKVALVSKICPLIPPNRRAYWYNLPTLKVATL